MEIQKVKNSERCYDIWIKKDNKQLKIMYCGNLDLYFSMSDGEMIPYKQSVSKYFDITKENYQIYSAFDTLYNNIIAGKPFGKDSDNTKYIDRFQYYKLVDEDKNITWVSDDGPEDIEDKVTISKLDEDTYRLLFNRNELDLSDGIKSSTSISVRFRNSGSRYSPFNCAFMLMFQELQSLDPKYHQIHYEEVEYAKKLEKKRN